VRLFPKRYWSAHDHPLFRGCILNGGWRGCGLRLGERGERRRVRKEGGRIYVSKGMTEVVLHGGFYRMLDNRLVLSAVKVC
jgi:hypothetical protein